MKKTRGIRCGISSNVKAYLIEWEQLSNGERAMKSRKLVCDKHNTVNQAMLGRGVYYTCTSATSQPVSINRFYYASNVSYDDVAVGTGARTHTPEVATWTQTWTNDSGSSQTISKLELGNGVGSAFVAYCVLSGLSIVVPAASTLEVIWAVTFAAHASDEGTTSVYLSAMADIFVTALATSARTLTGGTDIAKFTGAGGATGGYATLTYSAGGTLSDAYVTFTASKANSGTTGTLSRFDALENGAPTEAFVFTKTGLSDVWAAGATLAITLTVTLSSA